MNRTDDSTRFDGRDNDGADGTQPLESGVLPDLRERLERLKEASASPGAASPRPSAWTPSSCACGAGRASSPAGEPCSP